MFRGRALSHSHFIAAKVLPAPVGSTKSPLLDMLSVKVKTRPDIIFGQSITNYKTAASAKPKDLVKAAYNHGYFMKEVFNALVFEQFNGYFPQINILAQSKKAPYVCTMFTMTQDMIDIGMAQLQEAFALWSACKDSGQVIDYAQGEILEDLEVEPWMLKV